MKKNTLAFVKMDFRRKKIDKLLVIIIVAIVFVALSLFVAAFDISIHDTVGKRGRNNGVFNNIDVTRIIVKRYDDAELTKADMQEIYSIKNVSEVERYSIASDFIFYFDGRGKDQFKKIGIQDMSKYNSDVRQTPSYLVKGGYVKSATCLKESDLKTGRLPESGDEVVVYSDYDNILGEKINYYIGSKKYLGETCYAGFTAEVVGILKKPTNQTYFSEVLCDSLEVNTELFNKWSVFSRKPSEFQENRYKDRFEGKALIIPGGKDYHDDEFGYNKKHFDMYKKYFALFIESFDKKGNNLIQQKGLEDKEYTDVTQFATVDYVEQTSSSSAKTVHHLIYNNSIGTGIAISISDDYMRRLTYLCKRNEASVYADDSIHVDRVISRLKKKGYAAISVAEVGTLEASADAKRDALKTTVITIGIILGLFGILYGCIYKLFSMKDKQSRMLVMFGMTKKDMLRVWRSEEIICFVIGFILGLVALPIIKDNGTEMVSRFISVMELEHILFVGGCEFIIMEIALRFFGKRFFAEWKRKPCIQD